MRLQGEDLGGRCRVWREEPMIQGYFEDNRFHGHGVALTSAVSWCSEL